MPRDHHAPLYSGTVHHVAPDKTHGFITPDGEARGERGIFVHWSECAEACGAHELTLGMRFTYQKTWNTGKNDWRAINVKAEDRVRYGTVKRFEISQGFGFIAADDPLDHPQEIFMHVTQIISGKKELVCGQKVEYVAVWNEWREKYDATKGGEYGPPPSTWWGWEGCEDPASQRLAWKTWPRPPPGPPVYDAGGGRAGDAAAQEEGAPEIEDEDTGSETTQQKQKRELELELASARARTAELLHQVNLMKASRGRGGASTGRRDDRGRSSGQRWSSRANE